MRSCVFACVLLVLVGLIGAWVCWEIIYAQFGAKAAAFDLSTMEQMESASFVFDRKGNPMGKIYLQDRVPVAWEEISPNMVNAVVAVEDKNFYIHHGVDWLGIVRAGLANWQKGEITQGASTVTQQLGRNSFDMMDRTYRRKLTEILLAIRIEDTFSKNDIMRLYLNRVYFGSGYYGVESATRGYFGKAAKDLTIGEAATLAGLLKSPRNFSPFNNLAASTHSRNVALYRMRERNFIDDATYKRESAVPLVVRDRLGTGRVSYAVDAVRQQVIQVLGYERAMNGGFEIYSTFDADLQKSAETAIAETLQKIETGQENYPHLTFSQYLEKVKSLSATERATKLSDARYLQGAIVAMDSRTGAVLALVGGRDFKHSEYNRVLQARRPAGTAFAPIVLATAFQSGVFPGEIVEDASLDNRFVMIGGESGILGEWGVETADNEYEGAMTMHHALMHGKNAAIVRAGLKVGVSKFKQMASALGITSPIRDVAGSFLGNSEVTLPELTLAFTPFGNGGMRPTEPYTITRIVGSLKVTLYDATPKTVQAMTPEAAYQVHYALADTLRQGTGAVSAQYGLKGFAAAGKTGTAYGFTDTYFVGYDSNVTCGVWVGFDKPTTIFRGAFGKNLALPIWVNIMNVAAENFPAENFSKPTTLSEVEICCKSGLLATQQCRTQTNESNTTTTYIEYGTDKQIPRVPCDVHGGGIRNYSKQFAESEWPRAQAAINLALVKPVAVDSPPLLGLTDVYGAVKPGGLDAIPVARALPVNDSPPQKENKENKKPSPNKTPAPVPPPASSNEETAEDGMPIRRAIPVHPSEDDFDAPAMSAPTPAPIEI